MNLTLLIELCGWPLLAIIATASLILTLMAGFLVFSARREDLLAAFLPLSAIPLGASLLPMLSGTLSSIALQVDPDVEIALNSGIALQMHLVPLLVGLLGCLPPALLAAVGRWALVWKASGISLWPERETPPESEVVTPDEWAEKEANEYLDQIVRPR